MNDYLELEVTLDGLDRPVIRRFMIGESASFFELHDAIQRAFGWENCHLWEFSFPTRSKDFVRSLPHDDWGCISPDAWAVSVAECFAGARKGRRCTYLYDFGDGWRHTVKFIRRQSLDESRTRVLLDGRGACPPEDCGGPSGHQRLIVFLETGVDPFGDDPAELGEWIGDWHPDRFDLDAARSRFDL